MDVTVTLTLGSDEFQTLRSEMREVDDRLRAELNELSRSPALPLDTEAMVDRHQRLEQLRKRLAAVQDLVEELGV